MALPVRNYPGYMAYEDGRIWSNKTSKFLKPSYSSKGYATVELFNEGGSKRIFVHRIIADTYLPNPLNLPQVNHKDENPRNNNVNNLEWCTAKYNMNYGIGGKTRHLKIDYTNPIFKKNAIKNGRKVSRPVMMTNNSGMCIASFCSIAEASLHTGIYKTNISRSVRSNHLKAGGYKWEYVKKEG